MMAEALKKGLAPIREKRRELEADISKVKEIMREGCQKARDVASETMKEVRAAVKLP